MFKTALRRPHCCSRSARLSTIASPPLFPPSQRRALAIFALTSAGGFTAVYFLWPPEYRGAPTFKSKAISPSHFTPVTVTASEPCGPDLKLLKLTIPPQSLPTASDPAGLTPIWSIFVKDDDIQVERLYTPLEGIGEDGSMTLWVKKYPRGEVGRWLHSKRVGETLDIRGPLRSFPFYEGTWDEVVLISGGTGFSPFYQLLYRELLQDSPRSRSTRFTILHGSPSPAELPPLVYLDPLMKLAEAQPERLRVRLFVDSNASLSSDSRLSIGRINKGAIERALGLSKAPCVPWWRRLFRSHPPPTQDPGFRERNVLVLVCGPEAMIAAIAGPYGRNFSQGAVGGALAELGFKAGQVWKL